MKVSVGVQPYCALCAGIIIGLLLAGVALAMVVAMDDKQAEEVEEDDYPIICYKKGIHYIWFVGDDGRQEMSKVEPSKSVCFLKEAE